MSYGWGRARRELSSPLASSADQGRFHYDWDGTLKEWYANDARGLEHGYVVQAKPEAAAGLLEIEVTIRGGLVPRVLASGRDVHFHDEGGQVRLTYLGLTVHDSQGELLAARWEAEGPAALRLIVDDHGASYPLTIDPVAQQAYLKASNTGADDRFGHAVAVSGDTIVVGALREDSGASGVGGDGSDNSAESAGAAYVFVRDGSGWSPQAYLKASNPDPGDRFGYAVAICGDTLVVGATDESSAATGVGGDQGDNSAGGSGAVYVFVREGTTWSQQAYIKASNTDGGDLFGYCVAITGDTLVVAAPGERSNATGVDGNQHNNTESWSGAAYVFEREGATWVQSAYLKPGNTHNSMSFGYGLSASGDTIVVGAPGEHGFTTGVNGPYNDNANDSGAAYAFTRTGSTWVQEAYIKASNTNSDDGFGFKVAVDGDTIVATAQREDSHATGVNGPQGNDLSNSGAAYVFSRTDGVWSQQAYIKASNTDSGDRFGNSLALSGDLIVVGCGAEQSAGVGVNANQFDNSSYQAGAAYVFHRHGSLWSQQAYLKASNTNGGDHFGFSVAASGEVVVVGAHEEDSNATGVGGGQGNHNQAWESGAAYVFLITPDAVSFCFGDGSGKPCPCGNTGQLGGGCANSTGEGALLTISGSSSVTSADLNLHGSQLPPNMFGLFYQGQNSIAGGGLPFGDGLRCVNGSPIRLQIVAADAAGRSSTSLDIGAAGAVSAGQVTYYQLQYRDRLSSPCGGVFNLTSALAIEWWP